MTVGTLDEEHTLARVQRLAQALGVDLDVRALARTLVALEARVTALEARCAADAPPTPSPPPVTHDRLAEAVAALDERRRTREARLHRSRFLLADAKALLIAAADLEAGRKP